MKNVARTKHNVDRAVVPPTFATFEAPLSEIPRRRSSVTTSGKMVAAISHACPKPGKAAAVHNPNVSIKSEASLTATVMEKAVYPRFVIFKDFNVPELLAQALTKQAAVPECVIASEQQQRTARADASSEEAMHQELVQPPMVKRDDSVPRKVQKKVRFETRVAFENKPSYKELDVSVEAKQSRSSVENHTKKAEVITQLVSATGAAGSTDKENAATTLEAAKCVNDATVTATAASEQHGVTASTEEAAPMQRMLRQRIMPWIRREVRPLSDAAIAQEARAIVEAVPMPLNDPTALPDVQFESVPKQQQSEQAEVPVNVTEVDEVFVVQQPQLEQQPSSGKRVRFASFPAWVALDMSEEAVDYRRNEPDKEFKPCPFEVSDILSRDRRFYSGDLYAERALQCALERAMLNRKLNSSARFTFAVLGRARVRCHLCGV